MRRPGLKISPDLCLSIGAAAISITPTAGLRIAEDLARKSFRRALAEEADRPLPPAKRRPVEKVRA